MADILLTEEQYKILMKVVHMGYLYSSGSNLQENRSQEEKDIHELMLYLLWYSKEYGIDDRVDEEGEETLEFDIAMDIFHYMERYDEQVFVTEFLRFAAACELHRRFGITFEIEEADAIQQEIDIEYNINWLKNFDVILTK